MLLLPLLFVILGELRFFGLPQQKPIVEQRPPGLTFSVFLLLFGVTRPEPLDFYFCNLLKLFLSLLGLAEGYLVDKADFLMRLLSLASLVIYN